METLKTLEEVHTEYTATLDAREKLIKEYYKTHKLTRGRIMEPEILELEQKMKELVGEMLSLMEKDRDSL